MVSGRFAANTVGPVPNKTFELELTLKAKPTATRHPIKHQAILPVRVDGTRNGRSLSARKGHGATATFTFGGLTRLTVWDAKNTIDDCQRIPALHPARAATKTPSMRRSFSTFNQPDLALKYRPSEFTVRPRTGAALQYFRRCRTGLGHAVSAGAAARLGGSINEPNGAFDGANGLFFWELFFHLPHLVADTPARGRPLFWRRKNGCITCLIRKRRRILSSLRPNPKPRVLALPAVECRQRQCGL